MNLDKDDCRFICKKLYPNYGYRNKASRQINKNLKLLLSKIYDSNNIILGLYDNLFTYEVNIDIEFFKSCGYTIALPTPFKSSKLGNMISNYQMEFVSYEQKTVIPKCIITPTISVSTNGYRVGHGFGCYDKYIIDCKKKGICFDIIAICFESNILSDDVDLSETHDMKIQYIVTENRVLKYGRTFKI